MAPRPAFASVKGLGSPFQRSLRRYEILRVNLLQHEDLPPFAIQALIALSTAISKVGPRPVPVTPAIGQYELATMSFAEACTENSMLARKDANRTFFMAAFPPALPG
jgi:hypothetical protein